MTFISYGSTDGENQQSDEDDTLWGWDDTELVRVGLSPEEQLRDIRIDAGWKSKIDADRLSAAVFAAYLGAVMARVSTNPSGAPMVAPGPTRSDEPASRIEIPDIPYELIEQVDRERDHYIATFQESLAAEQSFVSTDGNVTVAARGGSPISIAFDSTWMGFADSRHIAESATEALTPAIESGRAIAAEMRERFPAIAEFRRLRAIKKAARGR